MADQAEDDDRTEEPTQRKLDEAIKRGDVAKSQEINTLFVLGGFTLALMMASGSITEYLTLHLRGYLMNAHQVPQDGAGFLAVGRHAVWVLLAAVAIPVLIAAVGGALGGGIQHRPLWTTEPLTPKFNRISPLAGFKRLFGKEAWVQFVKGLIKIAIVGAVAGTVLWSEHDRLEGMARMGVEAMLPVILLLSMKLMGGVLAIYAFLAMGDAVYQRMAWMKRQRMSKQELKEEYKNTEGNPEIKGKLKQMRAARAKNRMMAAVPTATVVITNPTHFAVALKYERGMAAPVCVAKGLDAVALRIRAVATEHRVTIVENPPLARALHATVKIDQEIPVEHYKAVAEVIGMIMRLRRR
ncbi:MAG TPA: flagellar biosynthesis protein FlhB [Microvirga sp.]|jgi:flagellar biosynthetic protein FlhB|nr:flagellar biosynthesis protein FlhB [Microvirga sp.]